MPRGPRPRGEPLDVKGDAGALVHVLSANAGGEWLFIEVSSSTCPLSTRVGARGAVLDVGDEWR